MFGLQRAIGAAQDCTFSAMGKLFTNELILSDKYFLAPYTRP